MATSRFMSAISRAAELCKDYDKPEFVGAWKAGRDERTARERVALEEQRRLDRAEIARKLAAEEELARRREEESRKSRASDKLDELRKIAEVMVPSVTAVSSIFGSSMTETILGPGTKHGSPSPEVVFKKPVPIGAGGPMTIRDWQMESLKVAYERFPRFLGVKLRRMRFDRTGDYGDTIKGKPSFEAVKQGGVLRFSGGTTSPLEELEEVVHNSGWHRDLFGSHYSYKTSMEHELTHWNSDRHAKFVAHLESLGEDATLTAQKAAEVQFKIDSSKDMTDEARNARLEKEHLESARRAREEMEERRRREIELEREQQRQRQLAMERAAREAEERKRREEEERELAAVTLEHERSQNQDYAAW